MQGLKSGRGLIVAKLPFHRIDAGYAIDLKLLGKIDAISHPVEIVIDHGWIKITLIKNRQSGTATPLPGGV